MKHMITMIAKQFTPDWCSKPITMSSFLTEISRLRRTGEMDNAVSKLVRTAKSEVKLEHHENAAFFFQEAGKILIHSYEENDRLQAAGILGLGAEEYESAAKDIISRKDKDPIDAPHEAAILYSIAARLYRMTGLDEDLQDSARCFHTAASLYKNAAYLSSAADMPAEKTEALWLLYSEANISCSSALMLRSTPSINERLAIAESMEAAHEGYMEVGYESTALLYLTKAINVIKEQPNISTAEYNHLIWMLQKSERMNLKAGNIVAAAEAILDMHNYGKNNE